MKRYIQNIISSFINKVIVHYKHQKAKERIVRYRKGRRTIYIIRIDFPMAGLFAIAKSVLCHIEYALDKGWIPVVDLCNSVNQFKTNDGKNPWELLFAQPMTTGLDDISSEDNIIISCRDQSPNPNYRLTVDALLPENDNELSKHSTYYNKYIRLSENARRYLNGKVGEIIGQRRNILGVLCRGTDYLEKKPVYHPIQPEPKDVILKIHEMQKNMTIDYVYLATEDMRILQLFQEELRHEFRGLHKREESGKCLRSYKERRAHVAIGLRRKRIQQYGLFHTNIQARERHNAGTMGERKLLLRRGLAAFARK